MNYTFDSPFFALLLLLLPCFWWCKAYKKPYYFPKLRWIQPTHPFQAWELWIKLLLFSLMVFSLMKPFIYDGIPQYQKKGRDLILTIDSSGSMAQRGFNTKDRFQTKFDVTLALSSSFIEQRFDDNIGIVLFGTFAYSASPLTYDLKTLNHLLQLTNVGIAGESTAMGDALMQAIHSLKFGEAKHKVIILLSDGYHNAGKHSPKEAVKLAKEKNIKIYTIGIGKHYEYDQPLLHTIAKKTGAKSYAAVSSEDLEKVYEEITLLEPSPIRSEQYLNQHLLILYPLGIIFILLLLWILFTLKEEK